MTHLTILKSARNFSKDLERIKSISSKIDKKISDLRPSDDDLSELIISAEDSINKVKDMHAHISDKSEFEDKYHHGPEYCKHETSAINLTNFVTEVHTVEYQQNSQGNTA